MMKLIKGLLILMICFSVSFTARRVFAEDTKPLLEGHDISVFSDIGFFSKYIWRGIKLDGDPVVQPGVYVSGYDFETSIWGSADIDSDDSLTSSEEVDYSISYSYPIPGTPVSLSGGFTYYDFPAADGASREWFIGTSLDTLLSPSITFYHDFGEEDSGGGSGDYVYLSLSHSEPVGDSPVTLDLSGGVGYNKELFIKGEGGHVNLGAGLTIKLTDICSISPVINYDMPFGDLKDADDGNYDNEFYGGVTVAFSL
ncbi:MAG: TorF family putative porin [Candidatus Omnitrophota bacterium]